MKNINSNISLNTKLNQQYKDLFRKKLKDRNKIKGFCFSHNNYNFSFNKKSVFPTESNIDISKKIMQRNEFNKAMKDYIDLKHNITTYDKKYEIDKYKIIKKINSSCEKINYSNLQELFSDFLRDKDKYNNNKISIIKSKLKLDNINRNIRINRINYLLEKISLNSNKIKAKIDVSKDMNKFNEKIYNKIVDVLNLSRKKLKRKINNSKSKPLSLDIKNIDIITKNKNKNYIIHSNSSHYFENKINTNENISTNLNSEKRKYNNFYTNSNDNSNDKIKNINSSKNIFKIDKNNKININIKKRPLSHSRNIKQLNQLYNISSSNTNINNKRTFRSAFKKSPIKIKNLPLYTTKIDDMMKEYYRIKKMSKLTKIRYKETHLLTFKEIDKIIKVKEDLLIFSLKQKYNKNQFPKQKNKKKINKKDLFIQKFKDNVEYLDKKQES